MYIEIKDCYTCFNNSSNIQNTIRYTNGTKKHIGEVDLFWHKCIITGNNIDEYCYGNIPRNCPLKQV